MDRVIRQAGIALLFISTVVGTASAQALSPPHAEYTRKANGMFALRNNSDVPLVAFLEVRRFSFDDKGTLLFSDPPPNLNVEFGSNSFTIPSKQTHYVFYKADGPAPPNWFAIVSTLIPATQVHANLRVGIVLPHFVYVFQQHKIKSGDIEVQVVPGSRQGEYRMGFKNVSEKLARVETIEGKGFEHKVQRGGFHVFPGKTRWITLETGATRERAEFRIRFLGGYRVKVPLTTIIASR
jgi:hypothetical protein